MKQYKDNADLYLQKQGIAPFDIQLQDIKQIATLNKEECYPVIIEHNLLPIVAGNTSILNNSAITSFIGQKVTFQRRYTSEYVNNDLMIQYTVNSTTTGANAGIPQNNSYSNQRFDNDLEIYSIKVTSRSNNQILNQTTQDNLVMAPLMTQIYQKQNYNLTQNAVGQSVFPINDDLQSAQNGATIQFVKTYKLSQLYCGDDGFFNQYQYISDDILQYEIVFTPNWTKFFESTGQSNTDIATVIHTNPCDAINLKIQQIVWKIPGILRNDFEQKLFYMKYDNMQRLTLQDVSQSAVAQANQQIKFNVTISRKDFGNRLKGLFIGHILRTNPLQSTNGTLVANNFGQQHKKFVPRNLLYKAQFIQIKVGQQIILDLDTNNKILAYFMSTLQFLNIPQDFSKSAIFLREDVLAQFEKKEYTVFSFNIKMKDGEANTQTYLQDDLYVYCIGELFQIMKQGGSQYFDTSILN